VLLVAITAFLALAVSGTATSATTAEDLTAGLTPGIPAIAMPEGDGVGVWNEVDNATGVVVNGAVCSGAVCGRQGELRQWPADRLLNGRLWPSGYPEQSTYIWNPIGAASWGRYYTNGLYVAGNGQYVLPGETIVRTFGSDATPPPTVPTTTTQAPATTVSGGITGVEAYVINSNGVRCHLTTEGYWDHSRSCVDSSRIQFALCFGGTSATLDLRGGSLGMSVSLDGLVLDSTSFPAPGVTLVSGSSCQGGYLHAWAFDGAERGRSYRIDVWGRAGGVDLASSWTLTTPAPTPPPATTAPGAPTTSATTTTTTTTTTTPEPPTTAPTVSATTTTTTTTTAPDVTTTLPEATTSASNASGATTPPPAPPAGEAFRDGASASVTLTATDTAVTARSGDVVVEVIPSTATDGRTTQDPVSTVATSGTIEVIPLQAVEVVTSGFQPGGEVEIWLHSTPTLLARATADANGVVRTSVKIPELAPTGDHRLVVTGRSSQGDVVSVAMAVRVQSGAVAADPAAASPLPSDGTSSSTGMTVVLSIAITLALVAVVVSTRRRLVGAAISRTRGARSDDR